ncbi:type I polyketide synthase [Piscinibacter terrae]|uniref:SDR family NAD(P)-dependent oxidoreductase n=1 Tax=Piscinibacter terrae TaxID=2496871 RepID=A0A3N7HPH6_9BURK|nr:type I polyketide synthase [Albitalea terrae]RQP22641.1 SDR family NAD(P)-dependent oxidoreductase [Albitalea terrae]
MTFQESDTNSPQIQGIPEGIDIAVIGMACRFPGATDYRQFWVNLVSATNSITEIPPNRWDWRPYFEDSGTEINKSRSKWGGFIHDADKFEPEFFGISPREAVWMDPQQRIALELTWQCLEDAGYKPADLSGANVGVYIGACNFDYKTLQERDCAPIEGHIATGNANAIIPNRVSYFFNFRGPSIAVDTACSSSLVALQQAVSALRNNECDSALVGGVGLLATPDRFISFSTVGMLSPTGACRSFDAGADGYVRAEGAGLVMLKPLAKAQQDGDVILGVVKGVAVNHGGRARSLTAPNALSQTQVITTALRSAQIDPQTVTYVETHGTGTPLGDPIEVHGLTRAFERLNPRPAPERQTNYCALGAVKTNIGHLEGAAGIAGVIKVLLALRHRQIPPNANFTALNPRIKLEGSPFYIADRLYEWKPSVGADGRPQPLRACVSSFGFGGVNSHVVIEEAPASSPVQADSGSPQILALSARSEESLRHMATQFADLLSADPGSMEAVCRRVNTARSLLPLRHGVAASTAEGMVAALRESANGARTAHDAPVVGFLFTGQGSQYVGMGQALYDTQPVFKAAFDRCAHLLSPLLGCPLHELVFNPDSATLDQTRHTQPALFAVEYALAELWKACGVVPRVVMGHSVGEVTAACVAGILSLEDAVRLIAIRGKLMHENSVPGAMATAFAPVQRVRELIAAHRLALDIAAVNTEDSAVVSGDASAVADFTSILAKAGIDCKPLQVERAFHSALMEPMQALLRDAIGALTFNPPQIDVISNVTGALLTPEQLTADYWVDHVRQPVLFRDGVRAMQARGVNVFVEVGPSPTLLKLARRELGADGELLPSLNPAYVTAEPFLKAVARLHTLGVDIDFSPLYAAAPRALIELPPYPFAGQSYWVSKETSIPLATSGVPARTSAPASTLLGHRLDLAGNAGTYFSSTCELGAPAFACLADHRIQDTPLVPGAAFASLAIEAARSLRQDPARQHTTLTDLRIAKGLVLQQGVRLQTILKPDAQPDEFIVEVWSSPAAQAATTWTLHASGRIANSAAPLAAPLPVPDAAASTDTARFYSEWAGRGVAYGPAFQGLVIFDATEDACVATVQLPTHVANDTACHPALLDAIWQAALPLLPADVVRHRPLPLPCGIDSLSIAGPLPCEVTVVARRAACSGENGIHRFDYDVLAHDDQLLARVEGLSLRPVAALPSLSAPRAGDALPCYQPVWQRSDAVAADVPADDEADSQAELIVYAGDGAALAARLARRFADRRVVCIGIDLAQALPGGHVWPSADVSSLQNILESAGAVRRVHFLAGLQLPSAPAGFATVDEDREQFDRAQSHGVFALFKLLKGLGSTGQHPSLTVVGNRTCTVVRDEPMLPWSAACFGLARVYGNEHPGVSVRCVDLDLGSEPSPAQWDQAASYVQSAPAHDGSMAAYRHEVRFEQRLERIELPAAPSKPVWRQQGTYVMLGGAGGIGMALSRHLAEHYQAKIAWIGRSPIDDGKQAAIEEIRALGGQAIYLQADACDATALRRAIEDTVARFGPVNGAVHAALSLNDQSLDGMDLARFRATFDAKSQGSLALAQAVHDQPLDFIAFFSSAVSFLANPGQANYVAGCVFQDAYASHLSRQLGVPVKVFNWGRWGAIGAVASQEFAARLDAQGIYAIDPAQGLETITTILAAPVSQVMPMRASEQVLSRMSVLPGRTGRWVAERTAADLEAIPAQVAGRQTLSPAIDKPSSAELAAGYLHLNDLARGYVHAAVAGLLGQSRWPARATADGLAADLGVASLHRRCFDALLQILRRDKFISADGEHWTRTGAELRPRSLDELKTVCDSLLAAHPWLRPELTLLGQCGPVLKQVLRGELAATSVIFPNLSMELVEPVYSAGPLAIECNHRVGQITTAAVQALCAADPQRTVRVIEIGAGTGGTTSVVLQHLDEVLRQGSARVEYVYTDISPAFLHYGREKYGPGRPFLQFQSLDIEKPLADQGLEPGGHDILIASNVLHATRSLERTLQNVKFLLRQGGMLLLNEVIEAQDFLSITFGLLDGWWLAEDRTRRLADSPLLDPSLWAATLDAEGFDGTSCWRSDAGEVCAQGVLTAVSDGRYLDLAAKAQAVQARRSAEAHASADKPQRTTAQDVLDASAGSAAETLGKTVLDYLSAELSEVLQLRPARMKELGSALGTLFLSELGMDSLTAMDLRNRLQRQLSLDVSVETLLGGARVHAVVDLICEKLLFKRLVATAESAPGDASADMETFTL